MVKCGAGDVSVRSYFEQNDGNEQQRTSSDWWRILSLELSGFQVGVKEISNFSPVTNPIDLGIHLRKPTSKVGELSIRGTLSFVDLTLNYSDYILIRYVVSDNVGRKVDTERWDNIEKAYWSEQFDVDHMIASFSIDDDTVRGLKPGENRVAYSSNARFVRYGKGGKRKSKGDRIRRISPPHDDNSPSKSVEKAGSTIDVKFILDGLSLKLTRDDVFEDIDDERLASKFRYDIILLRVQAVEISLGSTDTGDFSFHLSLFRLGLFDLGDRGRSMREHFYSSLLTDSLTSKKRNRKDPRLPCPFHIIAEGYVPEYERNGALPDVSKRQDEPQFVVTVERCPSSSAGLSANLSALELPPETTVTIARVVVNFLSLNILIRPVKEALGFLRCEWPIRKYTRRVVAPNMDNIEQPNLQSLSDSPKVVIRNEEFHLKLVAHYPRVFFLADESDQHSRALVLRG